jgi:hypothetical protein
LASSQRKWRVADDLTGTPENGAEDPESRQAGATYRTDLERSSVLGPHFFLPQNIRALVENICRQIGDSTEVTYT